VAPGPQVAQVAQVAAALVQAATMSMELQERLIPAAVAEVRVPTLPVVLAAPVSSSSVLPARTRLSLVRRHLVAQRLALTQVVARISLTLSSRRRAR